MPVPQRARGSRRVLAPVVVAAAAVVGAGLIAVLPAATAAPRATAADLEGLGTQISRLDEQLNQAQIAVHRIDLQLADAQEVARAQYGQLAAIQRRIAVQAAQQYKDGGIGTVAALLAGEDTTTLVQKAETLNLLAQHDGDLLAAAVAQQQVYRAAVHQVELARAAKAREAAAIAKRKSQIDHQLNQLERLRSQVGDPRSVPLPADLPSPRGGASVAVHTALAQLGKPYVWGGAGPGGFDCSGLTMYAWAAAGLALPHSAAAQYDALPHVSQSELQPGDLVFFGSPIHHVGMYVGKGVMVAAPSSGRVVQVQKAIRSDYVGAARP